MDIQNHPIGVLDSGLGGISVLRELVRLMPEEDYLYFGDSKNAPYGTKTAEEVLRLTRNTVSFLLEQGAKAIVVACNTATSVAIRELRQEYPSIPMIGIEPALKPAVEAKAHSTVLVMATPMTLKKEKFSDLMHRYESDAKIIKVPCPGLVELIEGGVLEGPQMEAYLQKVFAGFGKEHMDAVVLGCTHFPLVKEEIRKALPAEVKIYDGGAGTARETRRRLVAADLRREQKEKGRVIFYNSSEDEKMLELSRYLLDKAGEEERKS